MKGNVAAVIGLVKKFIASQKVLLKSFHHMINWMQKNSDILTSNSIKPKVVSRVRRINTVADSRIFLSNLIFSSKWDNYVTVNLNVIHDPENTRYFSFFIVAMCSRINLEASVKSRCERTVRYFAATLKQKKKGDRRDRYMCLLKVAAARFTITTSYDVG